MEIWGVGVAGNTAGPAIRAQIEAAAQSRGVSARWVLARVHRTGQGTRYALLPPVESTNLYRRLHAVDVCIIAVASIHLRRDPTKDPRSRKDVITLDDLVRYKGFSATLRPGDGKGAIEAVLSDFESWMRSRDCEGENDPRVLPMHIFSMRQLDLDQSADRRRCRDWHGPPGHRRDSAGLTWKRPRASELHGRDVLAVRGRKLVAGFHWDVSGAPEDRRICSTAEVWRMARSGYLNIYPNEQIRSSEGRGRKVWSALK